MSTGVELNGVFEFWESLVFEFLQEDFEKIWTRWAIPIDDHLRKKNILREFDLAMNFVCG
jgi:hypothetical protein